MFDTSEEVLEKNKIRKKVNIPKKWRVIMYNDNYTSMEFVVEVLVDIFEKTTDEAYNIMMAIHKKGQCTVGVYPKDIAFTKIRVCNERAKREMFPLKVTTEEE